MERKQRKEHLPRPNGPAQDKAYVKTSPKVEGKEPLVEKPVVEKEEKKSWLKHDNVVVRYLAKTGLTVWLIVMAVGVTLAFLVAFLAV